MLDRRRAGPIAFSAAILFGLLVYLAASAWVAANDLRSENRGLARENATLDARNHDLLREIHEQQEEFLLRQDRMNRRIAQLEEEIRALGGAVPAPVDVRVRVDDNETPTPGTGTTTTTTTTAPPPTCARPTPVGCSPVADPSGARR